MTKILTVNLEESWASGCNVNEGLISNQTSNTTEVLVSEVASKLTKIPYELKMII